MLRITYRFCSDLIGWATGIVARHPFQSKKETLRLCLCTTKTPPDDRFPESTGTNWEVLKTHQNIVYHKNQ